MTTIIDNLQMEIGIKFDTLIPAEYKEAWIYYEGGYELAPFFWFCYEDSNSGLFVPSDRITKRKDLLIDDEDKFAMKRIELQIQIQNLQKEYELCFEKRWYGMTYELSSNGRFNINYSYERPSGSVMKRRDEWCNKALGTVPIVTIDMLR